MIQNQLSNYRPPGTSAIVELPKYKQYQLLETAISQQDIAELTRLLDAGVNPAARRGKAFVLAASLGFSEGLSLLWKRHANRDDSLCRLLNFALAKCVAREVSSPATVRTLLEFGATFNGDIHKVASRAWLHTKLDGLITSGFARQCLNIEYLMRRSIQLGHLEMVKHLHEHGVDITANNDQALRMAAKYGCFDIVRYLCENGGDVTANSNEALIHAANHGNLEALQYLFEKGADVTDQDSKAIRCKGSVHDVEIVKFLHQKGASLTANDNELLSLALKEGAVAVVRYLHANGVEIECSDEDFYDKFHLGRAICGYDFELLKCLVDLGMDVNRLFSEAIALGNVQVLEYLHQHGADVTAKDNEASRAAVQFGDLETLKYVHKHGAELLLDDYSFECLGENASELIEYMQRNGVCIDASRYRNAVIDAAIEPDVKSLKYLHKCGASLADALAGLVEWEREKKRGPRQVFEGDTSNPLHQLAYSLEYIDVLRYIYENGDGLLQIPPDGPVGAYFELIRRFQRDREDYVGDGCIRQVRDALAYQKPGQVDYGTRLASAVAWVVAVLHREAGCGSIELFEGVLREQIRSLEKLVITQQQVKLTQTIDQLIIDSDALIHFNGAVKRVATELVLPHLVRRVQEGSTEAVHHLARTEATKSLAAGRDLRKLIGLNRLMHTAHSVLPAHSRPYVSSHTWPRLFTEEIDLGEGYTICALGSQDELAAEGEALEHCLGTGGYATLCASGKSQVLSLRKDGSSVATIEFSCAASDGIFRSSQKKCWTLSQFKGYRNERPDEEARRAYRRFIEKAQSKNFAFNPEVDSDNVEDKGFEAFLSFFEQETGIPEDEPELLELIRTHYDKLRTASGEPIFLALGQSGEALGAP